MNRRALRVAFAASMMLLLAACGSDAAETAQTVESQVISVAPTAVATTAPLSVPTPTPTPEPSPTPIPLPQATATPVPTATVAPTAVPTPEPAPTVAAASPAEEEPVAVETPTPAPSPTAEAAAATETPTPAPTPTVDAFETGEDTSSTDTASDVESTPTPVPATPTAVVAVSEPPLECYDPQVFVYRAFVDGVDALSFDGGKVTCTGAGTNGVAATRSYRHSSGLVVNRNANYIFNEAGTAYIPYSGTLHFCMNGQPANAPVRADSVPLLLIVIDNEARNQVAQGAAGPAGFTPSGAQC